MIKAINPPAMISITLGFCLVTSTPWNDFCGGGEWGDSFYCTPIIYRPNLAMLYNMWCLRRFPSRNCCGNAVQLSQHVEEQPRREETLANATRPLLQQWEQSGSDHFPRMTFSLFNRCCSSCMIISVMSAVRFSVMLASHCFCGRGLTPP